VMSRAHLNSTLNFNMDIYFAIIIGIYYDNHHVDSFLPKLFLFSAKNLPGWE
jgi:hypothetical protein